MIDCEALNEKSLRHAHDTTIKDWVSVKRIEIPQVQISSNSLSPYSQLRRMAVSLRKLSSTRGITEVYRMSFCVHIQAYISTMLRDFPQTLVK